jgi:hypothetical protein
MLGAVWLCVRRGSVLLGLSVLAFLLSNALFHVGFTVATGVYSPGAVTSVLLYLPLCMSGAALAQRGGLLTAPRVTGALLLGAVCANLPLRAVQALL